ncbi:hypothetical protein EDEG_00573 [Edhazardia aedis USNM 41457]|uniref:non-specific serine/threonine protein kinase n=1 Tax=Edhazardia aedis (strain USNM 41457) TaxID=1003232 RepID=J8ZNE3_EDHAE|nr:hypothetical protein EDEG_00573 [Edhazardia aedis USNM 41457]|eukprot:EJW01198.1 hypothetical protein EDEG_00573 [Edhazardia aedis USNM 41457]
MHIDNMDLASPKNSCCNENICDSSICYESENHKKQLDETTNIIKTSESLTNQNLYCCSTEKIDKLANNMNNSKEFSCLPEELTEHKTNLNTITGEFMHKINIKKIESDEYDKQNLCLPQFKNLEPINQYKTPVKYILFVIDMGQAVESDHVNSDEFLINDIVNINNFFIRKGVDVASVNQLFSEITGKFIPTCLANMDLQKGVGIPISINDIYNKEDVVGFLKNDRASFMKHENKIPKINHSILDLDKKKKYKNILEEFGICLYEDYIKNRFYHLNMHEKYKERNIIKEIYNIQQFLSPIHFNYITKNVISQALYTIRTSIIYGKSLFHKKICLKPRILRDLIISMLIPNINKQTILYKEMLGKFKIFMSKFKKDQIKKRNIHKYYDFFENNISDDIKKLKANPLFRISHDITYYLPQKICYFFLNISYRHTGMN